jgi:hypothetical protein
MRTLPRKPPRAQNTWRAVLVRPSADERNFVIAPEDYVGAKGRLT